MSEKPNQEIKIAVSFLHLLSGCRLARRAFQKLDPDKHKTEIEAMNQVIAEADLAIIDILTS